MNNWRETTLGKVANVFTGYPFKSELYSTGDQDVRLLRGDNISQGAMDWSDARKWPAEQLNDFEEYQLKEDDIVLAMDRPWIGAGLKFSQIIKSDLPALLVQRTARLRGSNDLDIGYLKYVIGSPWFTSYIKRITTGSLVPHISLKQIRDFPVKLPPIEEQKAAAAVLLAIDKKIELNNRINAELEAMAKTLYDYWFVQFDFPDDSPQGQGKPYKTSGGKMVYNPTLKREIPEGWEAKQLSKITPVSNLSVNPADYPDQVFRHYSIPVYDATKTYGLEAGDTIGSNKFTIEESDILVSKLNPWFSRVIYAMEEEDVICSTEFVVWRTPNDSIKNFLYMVATSPQFVAHCTQSATGTSNSHKRVNPGVMMRFEIPFDEKVANALGDKLEPMVKQMIINQRENTELAKLRDWLLPMLMNGQVTVK